LGEFFFRLDRDFLGRWGEVWRVVRRIQYISIISFFKF
jgi:hypothetical protein